MKAALLTAALVALAAPLAAEEAPAPAATPAPAPALSPGAIVAAAPERDWVAIPAEDLLVMTLAPDAEGNPRQVVIQLMPPPFSQGWIHNIRLFARARWYDGISVNRVQDNYVVQWGDVNYDNPEATGATKPLPEGLKVMEELRYLAPIPRTMLAKPSGERTDEPALPSFDFIHDAYAPVATFAQGWPVASDGNSYWPTHCYGMVGVGRNLSPDTGSGAELYTVIGHAPRHLDRNIALVGRVIEGMEHLSSLPRGHGDLGFYGPGEEGKRVPILTVRVASDLPTAEQPRFEYLDTDSDSFASYAHARANRQDEFFIHPAGGADVCNIPVPVRRVAAGAQ